MAGPLENRNLLVTGGSGAFGQAFVRRALADGATRVCIFSRSESNQAAMAAKLNDRRLRFFVGDVRDYRRLHQALYGVDTVVHAAALKRVETCEADPSEAIATNIYGTQKVAEACIARGVTRACFLSTDKAAAPHTLYGLTKATAERSWSTGNVYAAGTHTRFASTRYGNVLESTGSVVPLWKNQFARHEPITITDVRCSRFWMTMADAVDLVVLALAEMRGGEVFVPKVGAAPILDLARAIVEVHGTYAPGHVETGLRTGEKLHEMLISEEESRHTFDCGSHFLIAPENPTWTDAAPMTGVRVGPGFTYDSRTNPKQLSVMELREMIG